MQNSNLNREEEWIAKYRAALDALPAEQGSHVSLLRTLWHRVGLVFRACVTMLWKVKQSINPPGQRKIEMVAPLCQLRAGNGQIKIRVQREHKTELRRTG